MKQTVRYVVVCLFATFHLTAIAAPARRALVIGNDSYPGNALHNARNDAKAVADALGTLGYVTTLALDVDRQSMSSAIDRFSASMTNGDVALVYYAGHGLQVGGENYLVPTDFRVSDETDVKVQGYSLGQILGKLTEHGATTQIVILDACRDNPFLGTRSVKGGWAVLGTSAGTFLAFGTSPGSTASDDPAEDHGLFTKSLLRFIAANLDVEAMFQKVRQDVIQASNGHQVPWTSSSLVGSFHLNPTGDLQAPTIQLAQRSAIGPRGPVRSLNVPGVPTANEDTPRGEEAALLNHALDSVRGVNFTGAMKDLEAVLAIDPRCSLALRVLGVLYHLTGRSTDAEEMLDRAVQINPGDRVALSYRCLVAMGTGAREGAKDCKTAISIKDDLPEAHVGLALDFSYDRDFKRAYDEASRAIKLDPQSSTTLNLRGNIQAEANHRKLAEQDYARATKIAVDKAR